MTHIQELDRKKVFTLKNQQLKLTSFFFIKEMSVNLKDITHLYVKPTSYLFNGFLEIVSEEPSGQKIYKYIYENEKNDLILLDFQEQFLKAKENLK